MFGDQEDIIAPFPERRQAKLKHVQTVKQVLAEAVRTDRRHNVPVGRGDQAHINFQLLRAADAREGAVFQETEQLGL